MSRNQYSIANHTILSLIYRVLQPEIQNIIYLLKDPKTKTLSMLGSSIEATSIFLNTKKQSLQQIQHQSESKLKYIFFNDQGETPKHKFIPTQRKEQLITAQIQGDLRPLVVGDHSICFIDSKGYKNPFSLIAVTHLTQSSTKIPVLFPGSLIRPWYLFSQQSSIDYRNNEIKPKDYLSSLDKLKFFPNESYIFPSSTVQNDDLLFAKALVQSPFIDQKINLFSKNEKFGDALIPTTVLEEKIMNPFLMTEKFKDILGTSDKEKSFALLRRMRQQFRKQ